MELRQTKSPKKPIRSGTLSRRSSRLGQKSERSFIQPWEIEDFSFEEEFNKDGTRTVITANNARDREIKVLSPSAAHRSLSPQVAMPIKEKINKKDVSQQHSNSKKVVKDHEGIVESVPKSYLEENLPIYELKTTLSQNKREILQDSHRKHASKSISTNKNCAVNSIDESGINKSPEKSKIEANTYLLHGLKHYMNEKKYSVEGSLGIAKFPKNESMSSGIIKGKAGRSANFILQRPSNDESQIKRDNSSYNVSSRLKAIDNSMNIPPVPAEPKGARRFYSVPKNAIKAKDYMINETTGIQKRIKGLSNISDSRTDINGNQNNESNSIIFKSPAREIADMNFFSELEERKKSLKEKITPALFAESNKLSNSPTNLDLLIGLISPTISNHGILNHIEKEEPQKSERTQQKIEIARDNHFFMKMNTKKESPEWLKSFKSPSKGSFTLTYKRGKRMRKALDVKEGSNSRSTNQANEQSSLPVIDSTKKIMQNFIGKAMRDREKHNNGISWETDPKLIKDAAMSSRLKQTPLLKLLQKQIESQDRDEVIMPKKLFSQASSPLFSNIVVDKVIGSPGDNFSSKPFNLHDIHSNEHSLVGKKFKPLFHLAPSPSNIKTVNSELKQKLNQAKKGPALF